MIHAPKNSQSAPNSVLAGLAMRSLLSICIFSLATPCTRFKVFIFQSPKIAHIVKNRAYLQKWDAAVPTRQIRSRTFPGFRPIYRGGSNANDTKPHKSVHLYRPGTLLEQGASCFISGAKIEGMVIKFPHSFARARSSANFQQRESKATYPHLHFFLIR